MTEEDRPRGSEPSIDHLIVGGHIVDAETWRDVARFRRAERSRLIAARALPTVVRQTATEALIRTLSDVVLFTAGTRIAVYWPIRGEPDLRGWMSAAHTEGATILLPDVVERDVPLEFRPWSPGCRMLRGMWNIPVPAEGVSATPDVVISPLVGVDEQLFRLGNGGGYYDRTLASLTPRPRVIGVGFAGSAIPTIFPMPWDVPMDTIVLSDGTVEHRP